jgi:hypothetical protein
VQYIDGEADEITRWLAPLESGWTLPIAPDADEIVLAISPFATLTRVPMPYTLELSSTLYVQAA